MLVRIQSKKNFLSLLLGTQNSAATFEDSLAASYKTKHSLTIWSSNCTPWYLPRGVENLCLCKILHMNVYISFIQNCQKLEVAKTSFRRWMGKWSAVHLTVEYYLALKRNELPSHKKTQRNLKCLSPSESSQSEKATCFTTPTTTWHPRKGKTVEIVRDEQLPGAGR